MSFDPTELIPIEYRSLFAIISPIEKSGILKIIRENYVDMKDKYEALFLGLKGYLTKYQGEDISSLVFIMFGQISMDLTKEKDIIAMAGVYPFSPEMQFYKIQLQVDKGIFDNIEEVITKSRLSDENRNRIFNRLVAADKLASIILDLQSFLMEIMFHGMKQEYEKIEELSQKAEEVWKRAVKWVESKEVVFVQELAIRMILQKSQILMSAQNLDAAVAYYERADIKQVLELSQSIVMKANILHVSAMLYYSAGQPTKGLEYLEKAEKLLNKVHGRQSWKSTFYHNLAYMFTLTDADRCIEAYEKCLDLVEGTGDYQSIATTLSNLIGIHNQANRKGEARKYLKRLVEILDTSEELVTPFRAYAVASNAMTLDDYDLAAKYLKILEEKVAQAPTLMNKAILASSKFVYYLDAEINSELAYKYGEESLYYFNKQKDYLNALASVYNLVNTDLQFYKISEKERYLSSAKKRLNDLLTLVGALDLPQWVAIKNITLAGFEILSQNLEAAEKYINEIPESEDSKIKANKKMISQLLEFSKRKKTEEEKDETEILFTEPLLNEIATNKDAAKVMVMHILESTMEELVQLPQQIDPIKADIKLILLINNAGLTIYTKIFDVQKMNQQLISNFISAIDSFGKQLFGTTESYFSISRGNNIILYQNIADDLNLALIVSQENYDARMKLNTLSKEISEFMIDKSLILNKELEESSPLFNWLEEKVAELLS
ncbi:MAG: tetratricopeptide repeat protein [Candidatus Heimdallarchaeota archaeon]|nr:MAG: tetratricopeptide repeat protein [Candidatus Heimdallarchaeota archaeon]